MNLDRVQKRLEETGQSANMASIQAGLGRDYIRDLLRGKVREPSAARLRRLAEALQCSPEYLLGSEEEIGSAPTDLYTPPSNELPVSYRIRGGFYEGNDGTLPAEINWPVPAQMLFERHQWLEWVQDASDSTPVPTNALLHVTRMIRRLESDDLLVILRSAADGQMMQRTVRRIHHMEGDTFAVSPPLSGSSTALSQDQLLTGENAYGARLIGRVCAIYQYLDGQVEDAMRGAGINAG